MSDFDENIRKALEDDEAFTGLMAQLREAATSEVSVRDDTPCANPKCNCKHVRMVKVPDYKTKLAIAEFLANRGVGRPNATETSAEEQIVFERVVYLYDVEQDNAELGGEAA